MVLSEVEKRRKGIEPFDLIKYSECFILVAFEGLMVIFRPHREYEL